VFSSDSPGEPTFEAMGDRFTVTTHAAVDSGLACGIAADDYLLTVAHVVGKYNWVAGYIGGRVVIRRAEVVAKRNFDRPGAEFAILRTEAGIDHPIGLTRASGVHRPIFVLVASRTGDASVQCLGASIVKTSDAVGDANCVVLFTDLPTWSGDSGGPALDGDGNLVGVVAGWVRAFPLSHALKTVCCPNPSTVSQIIETDRKQHARRPESISLRASIQPPAYCF
jgi:hypothetical protein